jgi:CheY-like chemotaxis protein
MMLRPSQPDDPSIPAPGWELRAEGTNRGGSHRLNLLLSHAPAARHEAATFHLLPPLLSPMGIRTIEVESGEDAAEAIRTQPIHIAVIDFAVPLARHQPAPPSAPAVAAGGGPGAPGGARVLQLLRRLQQPPPTVIVRPPQHSFREHARSLSDALREGAFAVLDRPVNIEMMLEVMRRILHRHYAGHWPS